ncbi:hypothetical protein V6C32_01015 [Desulforamulus ruminis]|uniref:hypothetical protein n=1 Tax=Desulforamulus ruminis TaxID=1564 RepID=UPI002FD9AE42
MEFLFPFLVLFLVIILALGMFFFIQQTSSMPRFMQEKKKKLNKPEEIFKEAHISELIHYKYIQNGIYRQGNRYFGIASLNGANFSVMSTPEQDNKESMIVSILSQVDYPNQYISNTVISDTEKGALEVRRRIKEASPEELTPGLRAYMTLYADFLTGMKLQRAVLSAQSWLVIGSLNDDDDPEEAIIKRFEHISKKLHQRVGIVITRLTKREDIYDALHQILLPDRIISPSSRVNAGVTEPLHWSRNEISKGVE